MTDWALRELVSDTHSDRERAAVTDHTSPDLTLSSTCKGEAARSLSTSQVLKSMTFTDLNFFLIDGLCKYLPSFYSLMH